jgi:hypothetical protein
VPVGLTEHWPHLLRRRAATWPDGGLQNVVFFPLANGHFPAGASHKAPACRYIFRSASKKPVIMA